MQKKSSCYVPNPLISSVLLALGDEGSRMNKLYSDVSKHREVAEEESGPYPLVSFQGHVGPGSFDSDSYWARSLLSKYDCLQTGIDTPAVAVASWRAAEEKCRDTNQILVSSLFKSSSCYSFDREVIREARKFCLKILGEFSWDSAYPYCDYGPGASIGVPRRRCGLRHKIGAKNPTATGPCEDLVNTYYTYNERLAKFRQENGVKVEYVRGNRLATVPKNAKTDRVIAIEPLLNMFFQKGIGGLMRSKLRRFGCDLNDQRINQAFALEGSKTGLLATLDLSMASDTVSRELVELLIPDSWLLPMKIVRSAFTELDGGFHFLQKFSSMGNGFTFELESLIFLSVALAIRKLAFPTLGQHLISVYGDDIIVPAVMATTLQQCLGVLGFSVNAKKSFWHGSFRESCGTHAYDGADVTPIYIKEKIDGPERNLWFLNSVRRLAHRSLGTGYGCDSRFRGSWELILSSIPFRYQRLSIPEGYGDGGVVREFDEAIPRPRRKKNYVDGWLAESCSRKYPSNHPSGEEVLLASLWRLGRLQPGCSAGEAGVWPSEEVILDRGYRKRFHKLLVPQWGALGPWV